MEIGSIWEVNPSLSASFSVPPFWLNAKTLENLRFRLARTSQWRSVYGMQNDPFCDPAKKSKADLRSPLLLARQAQPVSSAPA
jgi:hypothetical protein